MKTHRRLKKDEYLRDNQNEQELLEQRENVTIIN